MRTASELKERIQRYRATIDEIERQVSSIEHRDDNSPAAIESAIHSQNASFMALASLVGAIHAEIEGLKEDYTKWYRVSETFPFTGMVKQQERARADQGYTFCTANASIGKGSILDVWLTECNAHIDE